MGSAMWWAGSERARAAFTRAAFTLSAFALSLGGCTPGGGDGESLDAGLSDGGGDRQLDIGLMPDATIPDAAVPVDMAVPQCISEGASLAELSVSTPIAGLSAFTADLDADADGLPDLLFRRTLDGELRFEVVHGRTTEVIAAISLPVALDAQFMPGLWPPPPLRVPITVSGQRVWYVLERRAGDESVLRLFDADTGEMAGALPLGVGVERIQVFGTDRWLVLADRSDRGCAISALDADGVIEEWGGCRLRPGPDVNGDGAPEILRHGRSGMVMLDGRLLEPIASVADVEVTTLGIGPDGALDLRGEGPELVSASSDGGTLTVRYHDPIELDVRSEQSANRMGVFERLEFHTVGDELRLVAQVERGGLRYLHLFEPGPMLRPLGEMGPFPILWWGVTGDVDADGVADLEVRGGSNEDGTNTDVDFIRLDDGRPTYTIEGERSARFDLVWSASVPPISVDLDGCEGIERVLLRSGVPRGNGARATRLLFLDEDDVERDRSDGYEGHIHALTITDLDGEPPAEMLEIRSENDQSARLRVFGLAP